MRGEALAIYRRYSPGFTRVEGEKDYWEGECPFCRSEDGFKAWGENEYFLCLDCEVDGTPEDFMRVMKMGRSEGEEGNKPLIPESLDRLGTGNSVQLESPFFAQNQKGREKSGESSSNLKIPAPNLSIISSILTLNLPGRELQIFLLLHLNRNGMTAREVSEKLQVPQSNIHRYLGAVEEKRLIYSEGKPKRYFIIEDARLIQKYCRGPITSKLT